MPQNCPYCKTLLAITPLGYLCMAKTNDGGHVCGTTIGDPDQVDKNARAKK
jgi:hypothetical protein